MNFKDSTLLAILVFFWISGLAFWVEAIGRTFTGELQQTEVMLQDYSVEKERKELDSKLNYLWSKLPEKERCRFAEENGLIAQKIGLFTKESNYQQEDISYEFEGVRCNKWLEKVEAKYLIP